MPESINNVKQAQQGGSGATALHLPKICHFLEERATAQSSKVATKVRTRAEP